MSKDNRKQRLIELVLGSNDYELENYISSSSDRVFTNKKTSKQILVSFYLSDIIELLYYHTDINGCVKRSRHKKVENAAKAVIKYLG